MTAETNTPRSWEERSAALKKQGRSDTISVVRVISFITCGLFLFSFPQELGVEVALKRRAIDRQAYDEAKARKSEIDLKREAIYREYNVSDLLELTGQVDANDDRYIEDDRPSELPPATKHKTKPRTPSSSPKADRSSRCIN